MSHISQRELDAKTKKQILGTFNMVLGKLNKDETRSFMYSLLSDTERQMLAKRLSIAILLKAGEDHASICDRLCVTRETIGSIDLSLMKHPEGYEIAFKKIKEEKVSDDAKGVAVGLAKYAVKAASGKVDI